MLSDPSQCPLSTRIGRSARKNGPPKGGQAGNDPLRTLTVAHIIEASRGSDRRSASMSLFLILLAPIVAVILDFTAWMEACHIYDFGSDGRGDWRKPIPRYFQTYHIAQRVVILSATYAVAFMGGMQSGYEGGGLFALGLALFIIYAVWAFLSFRRSLRQFWAQ